ncbi:hypothetical protein [Xenorhabdus szentirmaii]|uniref:hypothetical protein n=1 Tax=Xenorhabdus szentirmaii TaxID=290112 RepID=UPI000C04CB53|nr:MULTISPECIES: hypothetical protein [Xenorhabdus]MBD2806922.1 hypothetical protein [Xenorhabdus sp. ZM]PHM40480.1 hypothetical protein Xszus_00140 [Xenorhabdus szentirmaii]PHM42322.1 hypothetical protein Xszus_02056 [Xenorhabdus szentirmaii]
MSVKFKIYDNYGRSVDLLQNTSIVLESFYVESGMTSWNIPQQYLKYGNDLTVICSSNLEIGWLGNGYKYQAPANIRIENGIVKWWLSVPLTNKPYCTLMKVNRE